MKGIVYKELDIETIGLRPYGGIVWSVAFDGQLYHNCNGMRKSDLPKHVIKDLEDPNVCIIIQNAGFDAVYLELTLGIKITNVWDTMLMELLILGYVLKEEDYRNKKMVAKFGVGLIQILARYNFPVHGKDMRKRFINRPKGVPFVGQELQYMRDDIKWLKPLQELQEFVLTRDGMMELALMENKDIEALCRMMARGIGWSPKIWMEIARGSERKYLESLKKLPSEVTNWNSPVQVKKYFFNRGILIDTYKNLDKILEQTNDPILKNFVEAQSLYKDVTTYGFSWLGDYVDPKGKLKKGHNFMDPDGRIRCNFNAIINTGRMSASKPNLQQLRSEGLHRSAFIPAKGHSFVINDFEGQELGIMAAHAGEDLWINAMLRGEDIHSVTASILFPEWFEYADKGCTFPKKCKCKRHVPLRKDTKILNFMLAYGGGHEKFSYNTGYSHFDSRRIIAKYKKIVPNVYKWLESNAKHAVMHGEIFTQDPYGRRRVLLDPREWKVRNQGKNTPVQGAGGNMLKLALISLLDTPYQPVLVIHDEIVLEELNKNCKRAAKDMKSLMEQAADYITGIPGLITAEPRIAQNLMKEV